MPSPDRPNILFISLDDCIAFWRYRKVFGAALETPNLDRICRRSTVFRSAYCQSPVCSPSRASFMSGKSPHQTGITKSHKQYFVDLPAKKLWLFNLRVAGYFCSSGGKVVQGYGPLKRDVHDVLYSDPPKRFPVGRRKRVYTSGKRDDPAPMRNYGGFREGPATIDGKQDKMLFDNQVAKSAFHFLNTYDEDAPFYREVGFGATHGPWRTPARFKEMYDAGAFCRPADWANGFPTSPFMDETTPKTLEDDDLGYWQASVRNYFSAVSYVDFQLGRVWHKLKKSSHADNTIVVILSDHGLHLGERGYFRKHTLWEQVANVPLIIHDPKNPVGQNIDDPVGLIDIGPTLLDYLDLPQLEDSPGLSLRPQIEGASAPNRAVPTFYGQSAAVRVGRYRFIRYADGSTEMFDIERDWWQTTSLPSGHPDRAEVEHRFAQACAEYAFDPDTTSLDL